MAQSDSLGSMALSVMGLLYFFVFSFFTIGLFGYHVFLASVNLTTYEHVRDPPPPPRGDRIPASLAVAPVQQCGCHKSRGRPKL